MSRVRLRYHSRSTCRRRASSVQRTQTTYNARRRRTLHADKMTRKFLQLLPLLFVVLLSLLLALVVTPTTATSCSSDSDCTALDTPLSAYYCDATTAQCTARKSAGDACTSTGQCASGLVCAPRDSSRVVTWNQAGADARCMTPGEGATVLLPWMIALIVVGVLLCCCVPFVWCFCGGLLCCCC